MIIVRSFEEHGVAQRLPFRALKNGSVSNYVATLANFVKFIVARASPNSHQDPRFPPLSEPERVAIDTFNQAKNSDTTAAVLLASFSAPSIDRSATSLAWFFRLSAFASGKFQTFGLSQRISHMVYVIRCVVALSVCRLDMSQAGYAEEVTRLHETIRFP